MSATTNVLKSTQPQLCLPDYLEIHTKWLKTYEKFPNGGVPFFLNKMQKNTFKDMDEFHTAFKEEQILSRINKEPISDEEFDRIKIILISCFSSLTPSQKPEKTEKPPRTFPKFLSVKSSDIFIIETLPREELLKDLYANKPATSKLMEWTLISIADSLSGTISGNTTLEQRLKEIIQPTQYLNESDKKFELEWITPILLKKRVKKDCYPSKEVLHKYAEGLKSIKPHHFEILKLIAEQIAGKPFLSEFELQKLNRIPFYDKEAQYIARLIQELSDDILQAVKDIERK
jgi:hypothetical protein